MHEYPISVITISRQMGSLGATIAREVASQLGYRLAWRDIINQAALRTGKPELALAAIDELGLLGLTPSKEARKEYRLALEQVLHEMAATGRVVIVGRAGQAILHGHPGVLHVRIFAPVELRADRVAQERSIALECAQAQVEASDRARRTFVRRFYRLKWDDPDLYHLLINTAHVRPEAAAALICATAAHPLCPACKENLVEPF